MSDKKVAIKLSTLENIGNALRNKEGSTDLIPVNTLADRIAALPSGVNKLPQIIDGTITELTAEDLAGVTQIRHYAFANFYGLTSVTMPDSVKKIGSNAFYGCSELKSVTIGNGVTNINSYAFSNCGLTSVTIPDNVTSIYSYAFSQCSHLEEIIIGNGVTSLDSYMCYYSKKLASVTIGNSVTSIGNYAFQYCEKLTSVTMPDSVKKIGSNAFGKCFGLTSITIPDSVTSIDSWGLEIGSSTNKATITFLGTTPPTIKNLTFDASQLEKIIVPKGCGEAYKTATNWANFADYIEEAAE